MPGEVILVVSVDVSEGTEEIFNKWYNEVHLPEVLACPGYINGARYESTEGEPQFLAIYELESEDALTTPEMLRVRGWGDMFPHVKNFHGRVYRKIHEATGSAASG